MAKLGISTGTIPNDGTGDSLLDGAVKINSNFNEVYSLLGDGTTLAAGIVTSITAGSGINISSSTGNVTITSTGSTENVKTDTLVVSGVSTLARTNATNLNISSNLLVSGVSTFTNNVNLKDNDKLLLGDSKDFEIYFNGSNTILTNKAGNTGEDLFIQSDSILIRNHDGSTEIARFSDDGSTISGITTFNNLVSISTISPSANFTVDSDTTITGSLSGTNINSSGIITAYEFSGFGTNISNIPNSSLINSSIGIGGITFNLGDTDSTPAFNLQDSTGYLFSSLTGITTIIEGDTSPKLGGSLDINGRNIIGTGGINITGVISATDFYADGIQVGVVTATTIIYEGDVLFNAWQQTTAGINTFSNVGIGTTNPTSKLSVSGDGNFTGVVTASSFIGNLIGNVTGNSSSATTSTNVSGGIGSVTQLSVSGVSTLGNLVTCGLLSATNASLSSDIFVSGIVTTTNFQTFNADVAGILTAASYSGPASGMTGLTGAGASTYGNNYTVAQIVVDSNGRIDSITDVPISDVTSINFEIDDSFVGTGATINFGTGLTVSVSDGIATVTTTPLQSRSVVSGATTSINHLGIGNTDITGFKSYSLMKVGLSTEGWLRLYTDSTSRLNDVNRSIGEDPIPGSGVIAEVVTTGISTEQIISPFVIGGNMNDPVDSTIYMAIKNLSGSTQSITANLTILQLEA